MGQVAVSASRPLALVASPVLVHQGRQVRRDTPVLPEAEGPRRGVEGRGEQMALLVLGESTAAGVGVVTQADGLARALAAELAGRLAGGVAWQVMARTGITARSALERLVPRLGTDRYDLILVALGMNDVLRLRPRRAWQRDLAGLLAALEPHLRPDGRIILAGIPDLSRFPSLPRPLRTVLALHARGLDRGLARAAAQVPAASHAPAPPISGPDFFAADRFHPSAQGYLQWARHLAASADRR